MGTNQAWVSLALEEFHKRHGDADAHTLVSMVWAVSRLLRPLDQEVGGLVAGGMLRSACHACGHVCGDNAEAAGPGGGCRVCGRELAVRGSVTHGMAAKVCGSRPVVRGTNVRTWKCH